jgi:hypothetical protein
MVSCRCRTKTIAGRPFADRKATGEELKEAGKAARSAAENAIKTTEMNTALAAGALV